MSLNYYLKVDGVAGDVLLDAFRDGFAVLSSSWGMTNAPTQTQSSGKLAVQDFHFVIRYGKGVPSLLRRLAVGVRIKSVDLVGARKADGTVIEEYFLQDVLITSMVQNGNDGNGAQLVDMAMTASKVTVKAYIQNSNGSYSPQTTVFDFKQGLYT